MYLHRIAVEDYRCFRERQELLLSPVTVVFGRNNSGKSALVRAPLLMSTGFGTESSAALDLDQLPAAGLDAVAAFSDLVFDRNLVRPLRIELEMGGVEHFDLSARLQYDDTLHHAIVESLTLSNGAESIDFTWSPSGDSPDGRQRYLVQPRGQTPSTHDLEFRGLLPAMEPYLPSWMDRKWTTGQIRYIGSYREPPSRFHSAPLGEPKSLHANGQNAAAILAYDRAFGRGELIASVNRHLVDIVPGWEIDEVKDGSSWETVLRRPHNAKVQVNLLDGGTGIAQVLPLLVQCAIDERAGQGTSPTLQIVEEPEMHLHPAAHVGLADVYLRTAQATGTQFLIETHSETMLLRLRRRIAEGTYPPEMVGIHVVEQVDGTSIVRHVKIDAQGNLGDEWPEGYFSQDYHEVRALAAAQLEQAG